ncbi:hypothetical protein HG531_004091 [Fusarium graminearum]|nr:hypothetical protein HG531_004091 [Fusarium graminearum]
MLSPFFKKVCDILVIFLLLSSSLLSFKKVLQHSSLPHTSLLTPVSTGTVAVRVDFRLILNQSAQLIGRDLGLALLVGIVVLHLLNSSFCDELKG